MIAYDTNILIYALEGGSQWAESAQSVMTRGEQEGAVLSVLTWQEIMTGVVLRDSGDERSIAAAFDVLGATRFVPVTSTICRRAVDLTRKYGRHLYGYDAVHLATALEHKASVFVTNDKALLSLGVTEIQLQGL